MIQELLLYGTAALLAAWLAGLPALWRGRPTLSMWASGLAIIPGLLAVAGGLIAPRGYNIWTGSAGAGDGFGLVGLIVFGALVCGTALAVFAVTAIAGSARAERISGKDVT